MSLEEFQGLFPSGLNNMSDGQADEGAFGTNSIFHTQANNPCNGLPTDFYLGDNEIDLEALKSFILDSSRGGFQWQDLLTSQGLADVYQTTTTPVSTSVAPIIIPIQEGEKKETLGDQSYLISSFRLNKRAAKISPTPAYLIQLDAAQKTVNLGIYFYYKDAPISDNATMITSSFGESAVQIPDCYLAAELKMSYVPLFYDFMQAIQFSIIEDILISRFNRLHRSLNAKDLSQLNWFYSIAPNFILAQFSREQLWEDLKQLLNYEKTEWFVNSSNAMIKSLKAILGQPNGGAFLYEKFWKDPVLIEQIYNNLSGSGEHEGETIPNKSVFAGLLSSLTLAVRADQEGVPQTVARFTIDDQDFRVNSDYFEDGTDGMYTLVQEELRSTSIGSNYGTSKSYYWVMIGKEEALHPLALVEFTRFEQTEQGRLLVTTIVPAIMVKDRAYHDEAGRIEHVLRVGGNILAVAIGLATVGAGGWVTALALADLGLSGGDLLIQGTREIIKDLDGGEEFLNLWENIYTYGGIATAATALPSLVRAGGKALHGASSAARQFIQKTTSSAIIRQGLFKVTVKQISIGWEFVKGARSGLTRQLLQKLEAAGVLFVQIVTDTKAVLYSAIYEGVIIIPPGPLQELGKRLKKVAGRNKEKMLHGLQDLLDKGSEGNAPFVKTAKVPHQLEKLPGSLHGQMSDHTCAAASLRMYLEDVPAKIYSEDYVATALKTERQGNNRGTSILNTEDALFNMYLEKYHVASLKNVPFQKFKEQLGVNKAIISVKTQLKIENTTQTFVHAVLVEKIEGGKVYIKDPLPENVGSSYSVTEDDFIGIFNSKAVILKK